MYQLCVTNSCTCSGSRTSTAWTLLRSPPITAPRGAAFDGQWANGENIFDQTGPINNRSLPESQWQYDEMWSDHPGGINALACDGSVRFLSEKIELEVLASLCTRAGGEVVGEY